MLTIARLSDSGTFRSSNGGRGKHASTERRQVDDRTLLQAWYRSMRARNLSTLTVGHYKQTITQLLVWAEPRDRTLATLTHNDLNDWLESCNIGARAAYTYTSRVSALYTW